MSQKFIELWKQARLLEADGHVLFEKREYEKAAEKHKTAADLYKDSADNVEKKNKELPKKIISNYYIELANHYYSLATLYFYKGEKQDALVNYQHAIEEQKKSIEVYETLKELGDHQQEINTLKVTLHFYLIYENLCLAQIAFLSENYVHAIEYFRIAEIHTNLELEFLMELGDPDRSSRAKARLYYIKGQILRSEALTAMQKENRKAAKEKYLNASLSFEEASKLYPQWEEYKELMNKMKKMGQAIKD